MFKLKKKQKNIAIVLFVILLAIAGLFIYSPQTLSLSFVEGIRPLSVDQIETTSSDPFFNNQNTWVITAVVDGSGQEVVGTFGRNQENLLAAEEPFSISARVEEQVCKYRIREEKISDLWDYYYFGGTDVGAVNDVAYSGRSAFIADLGDIHLLDSSIETSTKINFTMTFRGEEYSIVLDDSNRNGIIGNLVRFNIVGGLLTGTQCPIAQNDLAIFRIHTPTPPGVGSGASFTPSLLSNHEINSLYLKGKLETDALLLHYNTVHLQPGFLTNANLQAWTDKTNAFLNSGAEINTCTVENININEATIKCVPNNPVSTILFTTYVNADQVGIHIPVGQPQLEETTIAPAETLEFGVLQQQVRNIGVETDSFDVSLSCPTSIQVATQRLNIESNEIETASIQFQGSGLIETCTIRAESVNNPANFDEKQQKVTIYPFCDVQEKPLPFVKKYSTELGCQYICGNIHNYDVNEQNCARLSNYSRWIYEDGQRTRKYEYPRSFHCIAEGKYMEINDYMDAVDEGVRQPFVPQEKPGQIWIPAPYCYYVAEYGYELVNGEAVLLNGNFHFDPATIRYISGTQESYSSAVTASEQQTTEQPGTELTQPEINQIAQEEAAGSQPVTIPTQQPTTTPIQDGMLSNTVIVIIIAGIIFAIIGTWYISKRR